MKIAGIICEYNPFHLGHAEHIMQTRKALGEDYAIVCVMSGNFAQRGDYAIYNKHSRAKMALQGGADLVIELPTPYVLQSAEGFAEAGVYLLSKLGTCEYISFGSESGDVEKLKEAANVIVSDEAQLITRNWLKRGLSYASARQKAADDVMGSDAAVFRSPNNVLGIEYIKAVMKLGSAMTPFTIMRVGGEHGSDTGFSATAARKMLHDGRLPIDIMPEHAVAICESERNAGRGPVSIKSVAAEAAILSRLRSSNLGFANVSGISEGLEHRFAQFAKRGTSVDSIFEAIKTKRYPMSRVRRMLMCAVLGVCREDVLNPPPYIKVLGMNNLGKSLLAQMRKKEELQIITKPASVLKMCAAAKRLFKLEADATDFYVLAYNNEQERIGGQEWRISPVIE